MRSYAEHHVFSGRDLILWNDASRLVRSLGFGPAYPGESDDHYVRCHELARAVHAALSSSWTTHEMMQDVVVVDGSCGSVEHSWLTWPDIKSGWVPVRAPNVASDPTYAKRIVRFARDYPFRCRVLDVYRPGVMPQVILIEPKANCWHQKIYRVASGPRSDIDLDRVHFLTQHFEQVRKKTGA